MYKKIAVCVGLFLFATCIYVQSVSAESLIRYIARQKHLVSRARVNNPDAGEVRLMQLSARSIMQGAFARATRDANAVGYRIRTIKHTNDSTYYILESKNAKYRPWGTYVFYRETDAFNTAVEVPNPIKTNTASIGIKAFIDSKSRIFLMSGTHPSLNDVTGTPGSVFDGIHQEISAFAQTIIQIKGFNKKKYPEIVLTSGSSVTNSAMNGLLDELIILDLEVEAYDGFNVAAFSDTDNLQAIYNNSIGNDFVGLYLNRKPLTSKKRSALVIKAIAEFINPSSGDSTDESTDTDTSTI